MKVKVINVSGGELPAYKTPKSAGMDVRARISEPIIINNLTTVVLPVGIKTSIPDGYEVQVRPRSGLAKNGVICDFGTVDGDYRGEIGAIITNLSGQSIEVKPNDRIAQIVFARVEHVEWEEVDSLDETERGEGGFGSTGIE